MEYILSQGSVPLKNNLIRRLVRNVIGIFRTSLEKKMEGWDEETRHRGELNHLETLLPRTFEEFLISGMAVHRKWVGERGGVRGVWTDPVSPDSFFYDPAARDSRGADMSLLGQIHELTPDRLRASFARDEEEWRRLDSIVCESRHIRVVEIWRRTYGLPSGKPRGRKGDVWRYAYVLPDGTVLREGVSPYPHASHPFVFTAYPFLDGEIHSFVNDLIDQQRYTNRLITLYDWVIRASAKGVLLFPEDAIPAGGDIQEIADQWGRFNGVIVYRPKAGVPLPQQVAGNTVNIGIGELLDIQMRMMEDVSGVNGALQGKMENKTMSGTLYNQQTENSLTSLRDILGTFDSFIDDSLRLENILKNLLQHQSGNIMARKTEILFRRRSRAGEHACPNGEIALARNALLIGYSSKGSATTHSEDGESSGNTINPVGAAAPAGGLRPPYVSFGLAEGVLPGWHNHPANPPSRDVSAPKERDPEGWGCAASSLFSRFMEEADAAHLFVSPLFALCAVRLADGSRVAAGPPVLLTPNSTLPSVEGNDDLDVESMRMTVALHPCRLLMRLSAPLDPRLTALAAEGASLDILISQPLNLWDDSRPWEGIHRAAGSQSPMCWRPSPLTDAMITSLLLSTSTFRMVSTSPLSEITVDGMWRDVIFNVPTLKGVGATAPCRPDYLQAHAVEAAGSSVISGRLTLWDLTMTLPEPLPYPVMVRQAPDASDVETVRISVDIESVKNGEVVHTVSSGLSHPGGIISDSTLPRWLFVPDSDARAVTFACDGAIYRFPLLRHPLLAGSFFWSGSFSGDPLTGGGVTKYTGGTLTDEEPSPRPTFRLPNAIWRSARGNVDCFPDSLLMFCDDSKVTAVCRAYRSSGLVATTAPTAYLFTDAALYLLREMDDATFRDAGLVGRYILGDMMTLAAYGRTLRFRDTNGDILEVSGTTVRAVSTASGSASSPGGDTEGEMVIVRGDGSGKDVEILTRALKVEGVAAGKRWGVRLLGAIGESELRLSVEGSQDLVRWKELATLPPRRYGNSRESGVPSINGLRTPGLRYFRFRFAGSLSGETEGIMVND